MNILRCYEILGLGPGATIEEVKIAYRDLVKVWHPDRFINDPRLLSKANEKIKEINEAYSELFSYLRYTQSKYKGNKSEDNQREYYTKNKYKSEEHFEEQEEYENQEGYVGVFQAIKLSRRQLSVLIAIIIAILGFAIYYSKQFNSRRSHNVSLTTQDSWNLDKSRQPKQLVDKIPNRKKSEDQAGGTSRPEKVDNEISGNNRPKSPNSLLLGSSPYKSGIWTGNSILTVENGTNEDALVKLTRIRNKNQIIRNFYIPAGLSWTAKKIPSGTYRLKVAFGIDWDNKLRKFNFDRSFSETEKFEISETSKLIETDEGYTERIKYSNINITLHKVLHGNFRFHQINEDEFNN